MDKITMNIEFFNQLIQYLATKPYGEVFRFIGEIQHVAMTNNQKVEVPEPKVEEKPKEK